MAGESIQNVLQVDNSSVAIIIPPEVFNNSSVLNDEEEISMVFAEYDSSVLYPLSPDSVLFANENISYANFSIGSNLLAATIVHHEDAIVEVETAVSIVFKLDSEVIIYWMSRGIPIITINFKIRIPRLSCVSSGTSLLQVCHIFLV